MLKIANSIAQWNFIFESKLETCDHETRNDVGWNIENDNDYKSY